MEYTETSRIKRILEMNRGLTELQFFASEIADWKKSRKRKDQLDGLRYYDGKHDILKRVRTVIGRDGELERVQNLPNNRLVHNLYGILVDQKTNYLLGKPLTVSGENASYVKAVQGVLSSSFLRTLKHLGEDAMNEGISWLFPYYGSDGRLLFRRFNGFEVLPFWQDDDHRVLDCALRLYRQEVYAGYGNKKIVERVEIFKPDGIWRYVYDGTLKPDPDHPNHEDYFSIREQGYNWDRIPLVPFRVNRQEYPLLLRVRSLQDAYNAVLSDFENNMQEDARNTILVIKNYDGLNLEEFRRNLAVYGAVKVREDGGVSALTVEVDSGNYQTLLDLLKRTIIANARGFDAKDERLSGNPNQMNIQSMYSDIDLDANGMETEFQSSMEELLWFLRQDFYNRGLGDFEGETLDIVFNRDILINESEAIDCCVKSVGLLSTETLVEQHPWTKDPEKELLRLKEENDQADSYAGAFGNREDKA